MTAPYLWRRYLGLVRVGVALACVSAFLTVSTGPVLLAMAILFSLYSIALSVRGRVESGIYQLPVLILDLFLFILCCLRAAQTGIWLGASAYFYLICFAALVYEWRAVVSMMAAALLFVAIAKPAGSANLWPILLLAGLLATVFAMQKNRLQDKLSDAVRSLSQARADAEAAREHERERIAADFHDGPLQSFISFQMRLEIIRKLMRRDQEAAELELLELQDLGKSQVVELRSFIRNMQPVEVNRASLTASIREVVDQFERDSGVSTTLLCSDLSDSDRGDLAGELLQIVREALNNVRKHSKASRVTVIVESVKEAVELTVEDDGSGFPFSGAYSLDELELLRLGPKSIKRRIRTLGGELTLESRPSAGAGLRIRIPTRFGV